MSAEQVNQAEPMSKMRAATIVSYGGSCPTGVSEARWKAMQAQLRQDGIEPPKPKAIATGVAG